MIEQLFEVDFEGKQILGVLHLPEGTKNEKFPCVIMSYGFNSTRIDVNRISVKFGKRLSQKGIAFLRFDFLGTGVSEGYFHQFLIQDRVNQLIFLSTTYLAEHPNIDSNKLGIVGFSDGCRTAIDYSNDLRIRGRLKAIALWSPNLMDAIDIKKDELNQKSEKGNRHIFKRNGLDNTLSHPHWVGLWVDPTYFKNVGNSYILGFEKLVESIPTLCVMGGGDRIIVDTVAEINLVFNKKNHAVSHIIEGANHLYSRGIWTNSLLNRSVSYFVNIFRKEEQCD